MKFTEIHAHGEMPVIIQGRDVSEGPTGNAMTRMYLSIHTPMFSTIRGDGKFPNTFSFPLHWQWPDEFLCGSLHFDNWSRGWDHLVITERHPEVVYADAWRYGCATWFDLLPLDMRRGLLEPMCRVVHMDRELCSDDRLIFPKCYASSEYRTLFAVMRMEYPCSLWEAIDRLVRCRPVCECPDQHMNPIKARELSRLLAEREADRRRDAEVARYLAAEAEHCRRVLVAAGPVRPRVSAREWRARGRK